MLNNNNEKPTSRLDVGFGANAASKLSDLKIVVLSKECLFFLKKTAKRVFSKGNVFYKPRQGDSAPHLTLSKGGVSPPPKPGNKHKPSG